MLELLKRRIRLKVLGTPELVDERPSFDHAELVRRIAASAAKKRRSYREFPSFVHLESLAICNAACDFCPYSGLERKGTRMPDELIEKVVRDLADGPGNLPFLFAPYKVSDPFLEPRLFDIMDLVTAKLPAARFAIITNGSPLTQKKAEKLATYSNVGYLTVSLNFCDAEEYRSVMGIEFSKTLKRVDRLHELARAGRFRFPIRLSRVTAGRAADERFLAFARNRFPLFSAFVLPRNDWIGEVITPGANARVPDAPCHRWFDMSVTATGEVAMCCMDGEARYSKGNVRDRHLLELYNQPHLRAMREALPSRRTLGEPCRRCTYLSG